MTVTKPSLRELREDGEEILSPSGGSQAVGPVLASSLEVHRARVADPGQRGRSLGAVTTSIVQLHVEAFGKGPTFARTELRDGEYALCFLRDALTRAESTLVAAERGDIVRRGREAAYAYLEHDLRALVEAGVERPVVGLVSAVAPELALITLLFPLGPSV